MRIIYSISRQGCQIIPLLIAFYTCQNLHAQTSSKRLLGSFILNNKAYNYEFTMESIDNYSFLISTLSDEAKTEKKSSNDSTMISDSTKVMNKNSSKSEDSSDELTITQDTTVKVIPKKDSKNLDITSEEQSKEKTTESIFKEFSKDIFQRVFEEQMKNKYNIGSDKSVADAASEIFFRIKTRLDLIDDEPVTAYFILKKDYIYSLLRANSSSYYTGPLSELLARHYIHRVDVETEDGTIKNISLQLVQPSSAQSNINSPRRFLLFKNQYPISISGKFDYEKFSKIHLYCLNCSGIDGLSRYIQLSDLALLDIVYENDKEDYSPSNRTFSVTPTSPIFELKKELRSRLLEVAAFTDFTGLDRNEPNGLLQFEAKRRININTKYNSFFSGKKNRESLSQIDLSEVEVRGRPKKVPGGFQYSLFQKKNQKDILTLKKDSSQKQLDTIKSIIVPDSRFRSTYYSFFSFIEPQLLFSKLEENNKILDSGKAVNKSINPLLLYQYQIASFGINLQVFKLSFPQLKVQWNVMSVGTYWGRTRISNTSDSVGPSTPLNVSYWNFNSTLIFRPDNRYGASLGVSFLTESIWSPDYKVNSRKGIIQDQFDAFLKTSDVAKLFFRFHWNYERGNHDNNFTQIQLGYSVNLFSGSGEKPQALK